jgi:hypothetical protein
MVNRVELPETILRARDRLKCLIVPEVTGRTAKDLIVKAHGAVVVVVYKAREHITVQCPHRGRMKQNICPCILNNTVDASC